MSGNTGGEDTMTIMEITPSSLPACTMMPLLPSQKGLEEAKTCSPESLEDEVPVLGLGRGTVMRVMYLTLTMMVRGNDSEADIGIATKGLPPIPATIPLPSRKPMLEKSYSRTLKRKAVYIPTESSYVPVQIYNPAIPSQDNPMLQIAEQTQRQLED
jgi:hypothetical protein